jgi:hypothetical protein
MLDSSQSFCHKSSLSESSLTSLRQCRITYAHASTRRRLQIPQTHVHTQCPHTLAYTCACHERHKQARPP